MHPYKKTFVLKDLQQRQSVNFLLYTVPINSAVAIYNNICGRTTNIKHITVNIHHHHLDFDIQSQKPLNPKYVGIALRLFSQILVQNYNFLPYCTNENPRKLFVTA
ncbi:conserved protein of unknown function [Ruminococcaceae bacterium BL-6]|nr:conserved protein of unknown function [Ruminococcaceae bacterium BL-6]